MPPALWCSFEPRSYSGGEVERPSSGKRTPPRTVAHTQDLLLLTELGSWSGGAHPKIIFFDSAVIVIVKQVAPEYCSAYSRHILQK